MGEQADLKLLQTMQNLYGPKAGRIVEGEKGKQLVNPITGEVKDLGIPTYRKPESPDLTKGDKFYWRWDPNKGEMVKSKVPTPKTSDSGQGTLKKMKFWGPDGEPRSKLVAEKDWNATEERLQKEGYTVGEAPGQVRENEKLAIKAKTTAFDPNTEDSSRLNAVGIYNQNSSNNATEYLEWFAGPFTYDRVKTHKLPVKANKKRLTMGEVRKVAKKRGMSINEVLEEIGVEK